MENTKKYCLSISRHWSFLFIFILFIFIFSFQTAFADSAKIIDFKLNGKAENVTFNPNNGEEVNIEVRANKAVKFTRIYICSVAQSCTGTSGNYTRYFTSSAVSDSIAKVWNGRVSSDSKSGFAASGEYKIKISMAEESQETISETELYSIFIDFSKGAEIIADSESQEEEISDEENGKNVEISAHSSTESLSNYKSGSNTLKVDAGRERLNYVNFVTEFLAKSNLDTEGIIYEWSFGDGQKQVGKKVSHTYDSPGEYVVILNATNGKDEAVSRTKVIILDDRLAIEKSDDEKYIIENKGKYEINIGGLRLKRGFNIFEIAKDTIIPAGKSIALSGIFKEGSDQGVKLVTSTDREVARIEKIQAKEVIEIKKNITLEGVKMNDLLTEDTKTELLLAELRNISEYRKRPQNIATESNLLFKTTEHNLESQISGVLSSQVATVFREASESEEYSTAGEVLDVNLKKTEPPGLWKKIWSSPVLLFRKVKDSFYEN